MAAYVRRLRDQAAVATLSALMEKPQWSRAEYGAAGQLALEQANALIVALGYKPPEDTP